MHFLRIIILTYEPDRATLNSRAGWGIKLFASPAIAACEIDTLGNVHADAREFETSQLPAIPFRAHVYIEIRSVRILLLEMFLKV